MNPEEKLKRLYWHSRRGMWELDLLLVPFVKNVYPSLSEEDQQRYERLIRCEDQDMFVWLMRRELPEDPDLARIVQMIIDNAEASDKAEFKGL